MAIPKTLKPLDAQKALKLIEKHTKAGTGAYERFGGFGDFIYEKGNSCYLIRQNFDGSFETGKVSS